jgi:hypothetical protein
VIGMAVMCVRPGASAYQALYDDEDGLLESFAGYWRVSNPTIRRLLWHASRCKPVVSPRSMLMQSGQSSD